MWHDVVSILVTLALGWGAWALNNALNPNAKAKQILAIIIIVVAALFLITPAVNIIQTALSSVR